MELLSISRAMKAIDQTQALEALVTAHLQAEETMLLAMEHAAGVLADEMARPFQQRIAFLRERLNSDHHVASVSEGGQDAGRELERFASECAHERERRAWECKQIIRTLAEATAAITQSGNAQSDVLAELAARIAAISRLETMAEVRQQLSVRVDEIKAMSRQVDARGQRLASAVEAKMRRAEARLQSSPGLAETDPMTGLGNRRTAENAIESAITAGTRINLIVCDLDHFKSINDTHGREIGDQVLQSAAKAIQGAVRREDKAFRWGGDAFAVLILDQSSETAEGIAQAIQRDTFGQLRVTHEGKETNISVTASVGTVEYRTGEAPFDFFDRADLLMYEKKYATRATPPAGASPADPLSFSRRPTPASPNGSPQPERRRTRSQSPPAVTSGIGSFIVHNHTTAPLRIEVAGETYATPPGVFVIRLAAGKYIATVTTPCATQQVELNVSGGSAFTGHYTCP